MLASMASRSVMGDIVRPGRGDPPHDDAGREVIYVTGWPKSGCTWLTRLLADVLNCRCGGATPGKDVKEMATEGWDKPAPYTVRKTHFMLVDEPENPVVPRAHRLNWKKMTNERVIHIVRDPRDIIVSTAHYFEIGIREAIDMVAHGWEMPIENMGWNDYGALWTKLPFVCQTSYEALSENAPYEMSLLLWAANLPIHTDRIKDVVERQSFDSRVQHIKDHPEQYERTLKPGMGGDEYQLFFLRSGKVGDWRNHLSRKDAKIIHSHFGLMMKQLGYIDHDLWWKELPRR